ncbi:hypothetical protein ACQKJZ_17580 [Sphingomonas sp. NPDC019816]|uniref:hypothetical protein n=1 Tax=Sphingomonas sp. NPDC019816 TaxID=3390679 RepID=UPI003D000D5D
MTPRSITLIGRNHTVQSHMTDAQRERAGGRLQAMEGDQDWIVVRFSVGEILAVLAGFIAIGAFAWLALGLAV